MRTHVNEKSHAEKDCRSAPAPARAPLAGEVGGGLGIIAGAAAGLVTGPIGMIVGASAGAVAGEAVGSALQRRAETRSKHDRELDDAISLSTGTSDVDAELDFPEPVRMAAFLRGDHDALAALAEGVAKALAEGDVEDVGATIGVMQTRVLEHLDGEERSLLDGYARYAPEDAQELLHEHEKIREALAEFDVGVDLHLLRADAVKAFLVRLQAHAARENAGLYCWAATAPRSTVE